MKIVITGTGNVATVLGKKILSADHEILQVYGRSIAGSIQLGKLLDVPYASDPKLITNEADLYILALRDDALTKVSDWLQLEKKLVVHTSGSVSKNVLKPVSKNYGVLYPLQSLRKDLKQIPEIPFLVDGNTADDITLIKDFAETISENVEIADDDTRLKIHVAAVIASNFSNHLYALAEDFCRSEKIDFNIFIPLIRETANRLVYISPEEAQTGPAIRNDRKIILKHLELLNAHPEIKKIYELMTESISRNK